VLTVIKNMAKINKKGNYSNHKNKEPIVKVIEERIPSEQLFPQSQSIMPVREFDRPLVKLEEAIAAWEQYQGLINALIKANDIVVVNNVQKAKKSGINKIAKFFGYSCEIIRAYKENVTGPQGGRGFVWRVWARAIARNGQFRVAGAACSSAERRFAHLEHDVLATAETRAKKRAIEELAGMGELELIENEEETEEPKENRTYKPKPSEKQGYKKSAVVNPKMSATPKQKELINVMIDKLTNDYQIETTLDKPIEELNKGEAADLIRKLLTRGKEAKKEMEAKMASQDKPPEGFEEPDRDPDDPLEEP